MTCRYDRICLLGVLCSAWERHFKAYGMGLCVLVAQLCPALLQPRGLQPSRLLWPWNSPGKNTGVDSHSLLQGIFLTQGSNPGLPSCRQILYCLSYQGSPGGCPFSNKREQTLEIRAMCETESQATPNARPRELEDIIVCGQGGGWLWQESGGDTNGLRHPWGLQTHLKPETASPALSQGPPPCLPGIALDCSPLLISAKPAPQFFPLCHGNKWASVLTFQTILWQQLELGWSFCVSLALLLRRGFLVSLSFLRVYLFLKYCEM